LLQDGPDFVLVSRFDAKEKVARLTKRATQNDKSSGRQPIHEISVLGPFPLGTHRSCRIPCLALCSDNRK
jgi:hypothetical protein